MPPQLIFVIQALSDCPDDLQMVVGKKDFSYTVDYEIRWRQFDDSELSMEMRYMPMATCVVLLMLTAMAGWFVKKSQSLRRSVGAKMSKDYEQIA